MQTGLAYIAGATGKILVTSTITPVVASTITLISSLRSSPAIVTLQQVIDKHDITCTLPTIEATCIALQCDKEPLKTAAANVAGVVTQIH